MAFDTITFWKDALLQSIRIEGGPPGPISRIGAMMFGAMYDAVNAVESKKPAATVRYRPYLREFAVPGGDPDRVSPESAALWAAHTVLRGVYAGERHDQHLAQSLIDAQHFVPDPTPASPDPGPRMRGRALGLEVGRSMLVHRQFDGGTKAPTPGYFYRPEVGPGCWRPTDANNAAATPHWGRVAPFCFPSINPFLPPPPGGFTDKATMLASPAYAAQVNEVKAFGTAEPTAPRTAAQEESAWFWANDLDGTYKPPGQLYDLTEAFVAQRVAAGGAAPSLMETARLFGLVGLALADAGVLAWHAKYDRAIDLWRPVTAIQMHDTATNAGVVPDPSWQPLSSDRDGLHFSPSFPAYTSGHATFGATHAAVLRRFFNAPGDDNIGFDFAATTEDPTFLKRYNRRTLLTPFTTFSDLAWDNAASRLWLGVHFCWDAEGGYTSGTHLGDCVAQRCLQEVAPAVAVTEAAPNVCSKPPIPTNACP